MTPFEYIEPVSVDEALAVLAQQGSDVLPLAGGQSLLILLRNGLVAPEIVMSLRRLGIATIAADADGLQVGAMATHRDVASDTAIARGWPLLQRAAAAVGSIHIRNLGTLGGSVAHADPAGDASVALLALDGRVRLRSAERADRSLAVEEFIAGPYETARQPDELLTTLSIPPQPPTASFGYRRFLMRAGEFPLVQAAVRLTWSGERCDDARLALGGGMDRPVRLPAAEALLRDRAVDEETIAAVGDAVRPALDPLSDARASAAWRADVAVAMLLRAIRDAATTHGDAASAAAVA